MESLGRAIVHQKIFQFERLVPRLVGQRRNTAGAAADPVKSTSPHPPPPKGGNTSIKEVLKNKIPSEQNKVKEFRKQYGKVKVGEVIINMMYGGMRGIPGLICETSLLDPDLGIRFRGYSIPDCQKLLPKAKEGGEPMPEGILWLLLTGDIPSDEQVGALSEDLAERAKISPMVETMLNNLPRTVHPMTQLSAAITIMNHDSQFAKAYSSGVRKDKYWEYILEDSLELLAKLPIIASIIYRNCYKKSGTMPPIVKTKDWSYNFARMLGYEEPQFIELLRMYLTIHSDHEGGNVSAHTVHLVGSALSDPFLSLAAGINGLAGPLHGLANQEVLVWLEQLKKAVGSSYTEQNIKDYVWKTLKSGQVVPGYGHAVLRKTDPRYICQREFALKYLPNDELFKLVTEVFKVMPPILIELGKVKNPWPNVDAISGVLLQLVAEVFKVVPPILIELGKVKNPWPNVDAHSGVLLQHYGMKEASYYTVLFGVSRSIGVLAQLVWARALAFPIERPKSFTTDSLKKLIDEGKLKKP